MIARWAFVSRSLPYGANGNIWHGSSEWKSSPTLGTRSADIPIRDERPQTEHLPILGGTCGMTPMSLAHRAEVAAKARPPTDIVRTDQMEVE